jgi:hypothetical protein
VCIVIVRLFSMMMRASCYVCANGMLMMMMVVVVVVVVVVVLGLFGGFWAGG